MAISTVQDAKERLLEAAGHVFAERGYRSATVREICSRAEANLAAVNYHFGDKERLYIETVKRAHLHRAQQVPLPQWRPDTPPEQKLAGFIRTLLERMLGGRQAAWHTQLMLREMSQPTAACAELVRDYIRPHFQLLEGILQELLPPGVTQAERRLIAFSIVGQCLYYRVAEPIVSLLVPQEEYRGYDPAHLAEHIAQWSLAALGMRPSLARPGGNP